NDSKLIDTAPDARLNKPEAAQAPASGAATGKTGTGEKPAVTTAPGAPDASLPQNHTGKISAKEQAKLMKKQQDMLRKKQEQAAKDRKKALEKQAKSKKKKETTAPTASQPQPADAGGSNIKQ
ncbi:MAG: hypothetical protein WAJ87_07485, partial [Bryobacteraceae bacterium]